MHYGQGLENQLDKDFAQDAQTQKEVDGVLGGLGFNNQGQYTGGGGEQGLEQHVDDFNPNQYGASASAGPAGEFNPNEYDVNAVQTKVTVENKKQMPACCNENTPEANQCCMHYGQGLENQLDKDFAQDAQTQKEVDGVLGGLGFNNHGQYTGGGGEQGLEQHVDDFNPNQYGVSASAGPAGEFNPNEYETHR